jgi:hypothetical protein
MAFKATIDIPQTTGRDGAIDHVAKIQDSGGSHGPGRLLHSGERGDWYLVKDEQGVCIIHIPDLSTGRDCRRLDVASVLVAGGPEREELLRLIGTLIDQPP